jgi:hypothetical protein
LEIAGSRQPHQSIPQVLPLDQDENDQNDDDAGRRQRID